MINNNVDYNCIETTTHTADTYALAKNTGKIQQYSITTLSEKAISSYLNSQIINSIETRMHHNDISFLNNIGSSTVVKTSHFPGIIFKFCDNDQYLQSRISIQKSAKKIVTEKKFTRLTIPEADVRNLNGKKVYDSTMVIIENELKILKGKPQQLLQHYANNEKSLKEAVIQMAEFICLTDLNDIKPVNLPLIVDPQTNKINFALVDLELVPNNSLFEGLFGSEYEWGVPPAYGLIRYFPKYTNDIIKVIKNTLPKDCIDNLSNKLSAATLKADKIILREQDIENFHATHGTTANTSAIPETLISIILEDIKVALANLNEQQMVYYIGLKKIPTEKTILEIIKDINMVISNQSKLWHNLTHAREWHCTTDCYTKDSNYRRYIYNNFFFIEDIFIPILKKHNLVHSILTYAEACDLDIHILRKQLLHSHDLIIQF
jgi:hypothetical protein